MSTLELINKEIQTEITKPEIANQLLATTFKGLTAPIMKEAIMAGMLRGFSFKDFLEKNIYAIPFGGSYSLITSIDYARKIGMRSGVVGISAPTYVIDKETKKIESCSITVKRKINDYIGEYVATVEFSEYSTGRNLWITKPKTMISKVAEIHALRKACPEELSQSYVEEEKQKEVIGDTVDDKFMTEIDAIKTTPELKAYYLANKGKGKAFDKYVTAKKLQLKNENL